jgi:cell division protein FtsI/penicillin-binding protein 2
MTWRHKLTLSFILLAFLLVVFRLFYWQVVKASELSALGKLQYGTAIKIEPKRGEIKTSDGFPIATNKVSYQIFANPKEIKDKEEAAEALSEILDTPSSSISAQLSLDRFWVPIENGVDVETKNKVEKLSLSGVGFVEQYKRFYPEASLAAHLLGFVGKDENGSDKGYFGLEGYYDRLLRGEEGIATQIKDAMGRPILARLSKSTAGSDGKNLVLSIDRSIQFLAEKKLKAGLEKYGARGGMVGIMDPKTGEVIAMASFPTFDPREYQKYSEDLFRNTFISDLYEPGSTFKPIIMSSAFDSGSVTPQTKCDICAGPVSIGGFDIHTWNDKYQPGINMIETIQKSDNTGMVFVSKKLGLDRTISYLNKFGIGKNTGIDLQGEVSGLLKERNLWYEVDLATTAFGQGISVTPIELLSAISAIANGGVRMEPHVVSAVEAEDGSLIKIPPKVIGQTIKPESAKEMTELMVNAVNKGEASWVRIEGYRVAGKTGTASIPIAGHYDPNQTIASFVGFAPADEPKFVMLVIVDRPQTSIYGAETAAPIFFDIARSLLTHFRVTPSGE